MLLIVAIAAVRAARRLLRQLLLLLRCGGAAAARRAAAARPAERGESAPLMRGEASASPREAKKARASPTSEMTGVVGAQRLQSWIEVPAESHFSLHNVPFGVFVPAAGGSARCGTRVGDTVVDLAVLAHADVFHGCGFDAGCFTNSSLNAFMALGRPAWKAARARLQAVLSAAGEVAVRDNVAVRQAALHPAGRVAMQLPARIENYTDFYASRQHATNVGIMFRGADNALQPNWLHLPVGYHGRASSVVPSGSPVKRPCGQLQKGDDKAPPVYGACETLDFELEIGMFVGPGSKLGEPIDIRRADEHVFGFVLLNDWSARDIQRWEYVPLGPFGAKNFCTSISPWVVTCEALEPFRCATSAGEQKEPVPLPYLREPGYSSYDIDLRVLLKASDMGAEPVEISKSNFRNMYWTHRQQLAHHTVTGCNMQPGDLLGSGTISGDAPGTYGSMLELSWKGTKPIPCGKAERKFLKDGDSCIMTGVCHGDGYCVGFGEVEGTILAATPMRFD